MQSLDDRQLWTLLAKKDKELVEKNVELAKKDKELAENTRQITELNELIKRDNKFWITDTGKQRHTSDLPPDMVLMME